MNPYDEMRQRLELLPDAELITILQDRDTDQWRPEVFDIVRSVLFQRGVSFDAHPSAEDDVEWNDPGMAATSAGDLVTVAMYANPMDAETDYMALRAKGLKVWIQNRFSHEDNLCLQVQSEDFAAAMDILQSEPVPSSDLPEDIAEPPCPKCGSRNVMEKAEVQESSIDHPCAIQAWIYHCASCNHKWTES